MKSLLSIVMALAMPFASSHFVRDHWMHKNQINPDYMHRLAMDAQSHAARIDAQHELDVWAAEMFDLTREFAIFEKFSYGFIAGFQTITSSSVCVAASKAAIFQSIVIVDNRFGLFMPDYAIKLSDAYQSFTDYTNVMYAYCNLNQIYMAASSLFDPESSVGYQRMFIRVLTAMGNAWWWKTECVLDGLRGENFYDVGKCSGELLVVVLDTSLG